MCSSVSKIELKSLSDNTLFHQPAGMRSFRVSALHVGRLEQFVDSLSFNILITLGSQVVLLHIYVSGMRDVSCLDMVLLCYPLCALWHGLCVMSLEQQRDMEEKNHRIPTCQEA